MKDFKRKMTNIGATYLGGNRCLFRVWAPVARSLCVIIGPGDGERTLGMSKDGMGYWAVEADGIAPWSDYLYLLNGEKRRADPASHFQPHGISGPSRVVDHGFPWDDGGWKGLPLEDLVIYEVHTGTFTPEGTFQAIVPRLDELKDFGITAVELMPVGQFPGARNWGYDGVFLFAPQDTYGGPQGLKTLVNECHRRGIAVILDVVYNHFGPEGNYIAEFGPYFNPTYRTPWGDAINFDNRQSNEVRNFYIENAFNWYTRYHIDGLRLDAIHAIYDFSATPFLKELRRSVAGLSNALGRELLVIAESDRNDPGVIRDVEACGPSLDAVWNDDFHHSVHALLTDEKNGYYADFGKKEDLLKALKEGFVYSGQYSVYRQRNFGASSAGIPGNRFIVFSQNHDQVGNRMLGERLSSLVDLESLKLAAGVTVLSPCIPLLFMGEEYGEANPFLYFIDHSDESLVEAVRKGRREEFMEFLWGQEPPDPKGIETFERSRLDWEKRASDKGSILRGFYKTLISLRKKHPSFTRFERDSQEFSASREAPVFFMKRWTGARDEDSFCIFNFSKEDIKISAPFPEGRWINTLSSAGREWGGPGSLPPLRVDDIAAEISISRRSFAVYIKESL